MFYKVCDIFVIFDTNMITDQSLLSLIVLAVWDRCEIGTNGGLWLVVLLRI